MTAIFEDSVSVVLRSYGIPKAEKEAAALMQKSGNGVASAICAFAEFVHQELEGICQQLWHRLDPTDSGVASKEAFFTVYGTYPILPPSVLATVTVDEVGMQLQQFRHRRRQARPTSPSSLGIEPPMPGECGLQNLGNTCYMNAALQCVMRAPRLKNYFLLGKHRADVDASAATAAATATPLPNGNHGAEGTANGHSSSTAVVAATPKRRETPVCDALSALMFSVFSAEHESANPAQVRIEMNVRTKNFFAGDAQQDSQEWMQALLDGMHEELNSGKRGAYTELPDNSSMGTDSELAAKWWAAHTQANKSIMVDLLHGQLKQSVTCLTCGNQSLCFDPFMYLMLPIPGAGSDGPSRCVSPRPPRPATVGAVGASGIAADGSGSAQNGHHSLEDTASSIDDGIMLGGSSGANSLRGSSGADCAIAAPGQTAAPSSATAGSGLQRAKGGRHTPPPPVQPMRSTAARAPPPPPLTRPIVIPSSALPNPTIQRSPAATAAVASGSCSGRCSPIEPADVLPEMMAHNGGNGGGDDTVVFREVEDGSRPTSRQQLQEPAPVPEPPVPLGDCFAEYCCPEENEDPVFCSKCKAPQPTRRATTIWRPPFYLLICLKRFRHDREGGILSKDTTPVAVPTSFDLSPWLASGSSALSEKHLRSRSELTDAIFSSWNDFPSVSQTAQQSSGVFSAHTPRGPVGGGSPDMPVTPTSATPRSGVYELLSAVSHLGKLEFGHYVAAARNDAGVWACYNDGVVRPLGSTWLRDSSEALCTLLYRLR